MNNEYLKSFLKEIRNVICNVFFVIKKYITCCVLWRTKRNLHGYTLKVTRAGFTLLEILTVLAVMGIISVISMPIYRQIKPTIALNSETRDLVSDLRHTQQLAVTEQNNYSVFFDETFNKYIITNTETSIVLKEEFLNSGISIESTSGFSTSTAVFNVTGAALESGTITLINSNNATTTISIKPSGYVKIE